MCQHSLSQLVHIFAFVPAFIHLILSFMNYFHAIDLHLVSVSRCKKWKKKTNKQEIRHRNMSFVSPIHSEICHSDIHAWILSSLSSSSHVIVIIKQWHLSVRMQVVQCVSSVEEKMCVVNYQIENCRIEFLCCHDNTFISIYLYGNMKVGVNLTTVILLEYRHGCWQDYDDFLPPLTIQNKIRFLKQLNFNIHLCQNLNRYLRYC